MWELEVVDCYVYQYTQTLFSEDKLINELIVSLLANYYLRFMWEGCVCKVKGTSLAISSYSHCLHSLPFFLSFVIPWFLAHVCFLPSKSCRNLPERGWALKCYKCISCVHPSSKFIVNDQDLVNGPVFLPPWFCLYWDWTVFLWTTEKEKGEMREGETAPAGGYMEDAPSEKPWPELAWLDLTASL